MNKRLTNIYSKLPSCPLPTEGKRYYVLLSVFFIASFIFSTLYFFPLNSLKVSIERVLARNLNSEVAIGSLAMKFPLKIQFNNVRTVLPTPSPYTLKIDSLLVKPMWKAFLVGKSGFLFSGQLNQGTAEGEMDGEGNITLDLQEIRFSVPLNENGSLILGGTAGEVSLVGKYPFSKGAESLLLVDIESLELSGLKSLGLSPEIIPLGQLKMEGKGKGTLLQLERFTLAGGAIESDTKGSVVLREPLEMSTLRLTTSFKLDPQLREIAEMLSLVKKPASDGSYQFRLLGTPNRPLLR